MSSVENPTEPKIVRYSSTPTIEFNEKQEKIYRCTPFIITFCDRITLYDIQNFIETGLRIVRFNMNHVTIEGKRKLIAMLKHAIERCCEKYGVTSWPIAVCFDLPNACIQSGYIENHQRIRYIKNSIVKVTADVKYCDKCNTETLFIDDPHTLAIVNPGTEIAFRFGAVVMICTERVNPETIKCKVIHEGLLGSVEFVCIRGIKYMRPTLRKKDIDIIELAKELKVDLITVNNIRYPETLEKVKNYFTDGHRPLLLSSICEQEGLDNVDAIIEKSDGVILAREFLDYSLDNKNKMTAIQLLISAKCIKRGKPFFISGHILDQTLHRGTLSGCDLSDITNAVLQGAGFLLRRYNQPSNILLAMDILDSLCKTVEPISKITHDFWRMCSEFKVPVNAAEASVLSCAIMAQASESRVVVLPTVSGRTARQLSHITPNTTVLTVSTSPEIARQLRLYRGIIPSVYEGKVKSDWEADMNARIRFGVALGIKHNLIKYGSTYVALRKSSPTSAYCDCVSIWRVVAEEELAASRPRITYHTFKDSKIVVSDYN